MRKITAIIVGSSLALQLAPLAVLAVFHEAVKEKREAVKQEVREKREQLKDEVKQNREAVKQEFHQKRDALSQEFKEKSEALRGEFKKRQEAFKTELKEKREAVKQELKDKREKFREEADARKDELKKKLGERRGENIEKLFGQMIGKFEAAAKRLKDLSDRIALRLNKAEENGKDVVALRAKLSAAGDKIEAAERALEDAKLKYAEAVKDPDFKVAFKKVHEVVNGVKEAIKEAHRALVDVTSTTKGLNEGDRVSTTTPAQ